jgi:Adenylate and Guanylate cyclase catalytic domain
VARRADTLLAATQPVTVEENKPSQKRKKPPKATIQRTMAARDLRTGTLPLLFRIGVHLGDVMAKGDDVFGDGVNVAVRLQSLAEAAGVRISRQAYDHVEGKLGVTYRPLGEQRLKNIPRPIGVYAAEFSVAMARPRPRPRSSRRSNTAAPRMARGWPTPRLGKGRFWSRRRTG